MRSSYALLAGLFAGVLGVALWVSANEYFDQEYAWGAIVVGVFVGSGVIFFAEGRAKSDLAFIGGFLALLMITGGTVLHNFVSSRYDSEFVLGNLAETILESYEEEGYTLEWRAMSDDAQRYTQTGYPGELWQKAMEMWQDATPEQRMEYRAEIEEKHELGLSQVAIASFDAESIAYLGGGVFAAVLIGLIFGGFMHESVIVTAYKDAAENEHVDTHPYLAPGSEYGASGEVAEGEQAEALSKFAADKAKAEKAGSSEAPKPAKKLDTTSETPALSKFAADKARAEKADKSVPQAAKKPKAKAEASDSSFAGFASQEPVENDGLPGFDGSDVENDEKKRAG